MLILINMDKCKYCDADAEFKAMVENVYDPHKHHIEDVCSEHLETIKAGLIEAWTKAEWLSMD